MIIKLNAGNDSNGNPRRVFVEFAGDVINRVHDEGYAGGIEGYSGIEIATTPAEYRRLLRLGKTIEWNKGKREEAKEFDCILRDSNGNECGYAKILGNDKNGNPQLAVGHKYRIKGGPMNRDKNSSRSGIIYTVEELTETTARFKGYGAVIPLVDLEIVEKIT